MTFYSTTKQGETIEVRAPSLKARISEDLWISYYRFWQSALKHQPVAYLLERIKQHDLVTYQHCSRVAFYSTLFVLQNADLFGEMTINRFVGFLFHDIGKVLISASLLNKREALTKTERLTLENHPADGFFLVEKSYWLRTEPSVILLHHERWDGSGYPFGLYGLGIPPMARVCSIFDVFDAITSHRPYRNFRLTKEEGLDYIQSQSGKMFDPDLVSLSIELLEQMIIP